MRGQGPFPPYPVDVNVSAEGPEVACCKVGLDGPLIPAVVVANLFRSARVSRLRRSADRRSAGDAPMVGDWGTCGRRGRRVRRPLPEPATGRDSSSSTTSVKRPSPPAMSRAEMGIHGLNRRTVKSIEKYEKRGVQAARNCPSADRKCWQRIELVIHGLNRWTAKSIEKYEKGGVHAARNCPRGRKGDSHEWHSD